MEQAGTTDPGLVENAAPRGTVERGLGRPEVMTYDLLPALILLPASMWMIVECMLLLIWERWAPWRIKLASVAFVVSLAVSMFLTVGEGWSWQ